MALAVVLLFVVSSTAVSTVSAAPTAITAPPATVPVNVKSGYSASQWTDVTPTTDALSGVTFGAKVAQNDSGWYFFVTWQSGGATCADSSCYGGIELNTLSNTGAMGSSSTPSLMILASQSFTNTVGHAVDEFISTDVVTPSSVESLGSYTTQSVCSALSLSGTTYSFQCYRPFKLTGADPQDPTASMNVGSTVEIAFAVGEFSSPGLHSADSMSSYTLTFSGSTSTTSSSGQSTTSSSSSQSTTSTTSTSQQQTTQSTQSTQSTTSTPASSATTITAYKSQSAVNVKSPFQSSQWQDTVTTTESTSGMSVAFKENSTGLLFTMSWQTSSTDCSDSYCYGGIELGSLSNTQEMGSSSTPTLMILVSPSFTGNVGEYISTGPFTPAAVEKSGYATQTVCGLNLSGTTYTAVCYRPFVTNNGDPQAPALSIGSTVELGFAVGEFNKPGTHLATTMQSYVLTISGSDIPSNVSTSQTASQVSTPSTFPGLNTETLFIVMAGACLIGVVLGIGVSVRARKAGHP